MPIQCQSTTPEGPPVDGDDIRYDPDTGSYVVDVGLDGSDAPAAAVVTAIATILTTDPADLPPLADVVDTDALGDVFRPGDGAAAAVQVSFDYVGFRVTVFGDGEVRLVGP